MKSVLITSAYSQDAIYLGRLHRMRGDHVLVLNHKDHEPTNYSHFDESINLSFIQTASVVSLTNDKRIDLVYNVAGASSVSMSWQKPQYAFEVNGKAVEDFLELLSSRGLQRKFKFIQCGSTDTLDPNQDNSEHLRFLPWSPYGQSKDYARLAVNNFRENHGIWCANVILTNHDSIYRKTSFVIPSLAFQLAKCVMTGSRKIKIKNPNIVRDWAHSSDIARGLYLVARSDEPLNEILLGTGLKLSLRDLILKSAETFGVSIEIETDDSIPKRFVDPQVIPFDALRFHESLSWSPRFKGEQTLINLTNHYLGVG